MKTLILSGVGGSTNWLPLVYPLIAIVAILYLIEVTVRFFKKKLHHRRHPLIIEPGVHQEDTTESGTTDFH